MTTEQKQQFRQIYNQLRMNLSFPGEVIADTRRKYAPVNVDKSDWSFDYALTQPDTPMVAQHRRHEIGMRFMLGVA